MPKRETNDERREAVEGVTQCNCSKTRQGLRSFRPSACTPALLLGRQWIWLSLGRAHGLQFCTVPAAPLGGLTYLYPVFSSQEVLRFRISVWGFNNGFGFSPTLSKS